MVGLVECESSLIGQQQAKVIGPAPGILSSAPSGHLSFCPDFMWHHDLGRY